MYGFFVKFPGNFDEAIATATEELKKEGFGVLTEIDVKATLKNKLDVDRRPYKILGACNPNFAHQALATEPDIGLLLPCNVIVREEDDNSISVGFMDPQAVLQLVPNDNVGPLATEVRSCLLRVSERLSRDEAACEGRGG